MLKDKHFSKAYKKLFFFSRLKIWSQNINNTAIGNVIAFTWGRTGSSGESVSTIIGANRSDPFSAKTVGPETGFLKGSPSPSSQESPRGDELGSGYVLKVVSVEAS